MRNEPIDRRVLQILRWSIIIQIVFLALSSFWPRLSIRASRLLIARENWQIILILLMAVILAALYLHPIEKRINRQSFLLVLYLIALITLFTRLIYTLNYSTRGNPAPNIPIFHWDAIFFLIIPLVFIAWQYSMREVLAYCFLIVMAETLPMFFLNEEYTLFIVAMVALASFARSGIFMIVGWIENRLVTLQRQQHEQLISANQKLRKFSLATEKLAQTQERNRIARELHDTLAHTLSSTSVQLEAIKALFDRDPEESRKIISKALENTKKGLAETRRALVDLRASDLEAYGLTQAIRNIVSSVAERGRFEVSFHLEKEMDLLSDEITHCIYRIAQEASENILRHSEASKIDVRLFNEGNQIEFVIQDNGKGFNVDQIRNEQLGIRGMRERVEVLGGDFLIESQPGRGTQITVIIHYVED
jgi:signal transduction histidine kinase